MGKTFNTHGGHGGEADATTYLLWLARHPKTAERLARKLCTHFVSDDPPSSLVTRLASVYTAHDTAIAPVLKALFTSREFAALGRAQGPAPLRGHPCRTPDAGADAVHAAPDAQEP